MKKILLITVLSIFVCSPGYTYIDWDSADGQFNCRVVCDGESSSNYGASSNSNASSAGACLDSAEDLCGEGGFSITFSPPIRERELSKKAK